MFARFRVPSGEEMLSEWFCETHVRSSLFNTSKRQGDVMRFAMVGIAGLCIGGILLAAAPAQAALLAHYKLDESSGTTASDSSGNGNNGTLQNFDFDSDDGWRAGYMGNAILQDGTNMNVDPFEVGQNVRLADNMSNSSSGTVSMWIKHPDVTKIGNYSESDMFYSAGRGLSNGWDRFGLMDQGSGPVLHYTTYMTDSSYGNAIGTTVFESDTWYHVALTSDGGTYQLYVNGTPEGTAGGLTTQIWWDDYSAGGGYTVQMHLGSLVRHVNESNWLGLYDQVRIYDTALSGTEIAALAAEVPEPSAIVILGISMIGLVCYAWRKRK